MATVIARQTFRLDDIYTHWFFDNAEDDELLTGIDLAVPPFGTFDDMYTVFAFEPPADAGAFVFVGNGFGYDRKGRMTKGTVEGFRVFAGPSPDATAEVVTVAGIAVTARDFYATFTTPDPADEQALARAMLAGDDRARLSDGHDQFNGYGGNDEILGRDGNDDLAGGTGNDRLDGGAGDDLLAGQGGNDTFVLDPGDDVMNGGPGTDTVRVEDPGAAVIRLAAAGATDTNYGTDSLIGIENAVGNAGADALVGSDGANLLSGQGGSDQISGEGGDDRLLGGGGDDAINGGEGDDLLKGGTGNDRLWGFAGNDRVLGQGGDDWLLLDPGNDTLLGGPGTDTLEADLFGGPIRVDLRDDGRQDTLQGRDVIRDIENVQGSLADDVIRGDGADNVLEGHDGADRVFGYGGDDFIGGGAGADRLDGGRGADMFWAEEGADQLWLGKDRDADAVIYHSVTGSSAATGIDVVNQFRPGRDQVDLSQIDADPAPGQQAFAWAGTTPTAHAAWYAADAGGVRLLADTDGDAVADFELLLAGLAALDPGDVIL